MKRYSIKDLAKFSGIKAHTIRMWEKRYDVICPERSHTNIRSYCDGDLKRLLNIALLNKHGYKISNIACMSESELNTLTLTLTDNEQEPTVQIDALALAMIELSEEKFEKVISSNVLRLGFEETMLQIVYPFLKKIGVMWMTGIINPAQEHFISNLIRQKLIVAIDGLVAPAVKNPKKFLLFCPQNELHELGLLFLNYMLRKRGQQVMYLGASVPLDNLKEVACIYEPDYLFTIMTSHPDREELQDYITNLGNTLEKCRVMIAGQMVAHEKLDAPANVTLFRKMTDSMRFIDSLNA